jgi:hypothetical protein
MTQQNLSGPDPLPRNSQFNRIKVQHDLVVKHSWEASVAHNKAVVKDQRVKNRISKWLL